MHLQVMKTHQEMCGEEDLGALTSQASLAVQLRKLGKHQEAKEHLHTAERLWMAIIGQEDDAKRRAALGPLHNLALELSALGHNATALHHLEGVLQVGWPYPAIRIWNLSHDQWKLGESCPSPGPVMAVHSSTYDNLEECALSAPSQQQAL